MLIKTFPVGAFQCNCTIIGNEETGEAFVIDPGDEAARIVSQVRSAGLTVKYIIHTHAHIDHIGATKAVKNELGGEICLHKDDLFLYDNMAMQAQVLGVDMDCDVTPVAKYISHGDELECRNGFCSEVIHTPGHTPGSVCFLFGGESLPLLFSGDTLFAGSIGRTDLWGGDHGQILASIRERLFSLPENTVVIPGHGPKTSVGSERRSNPFFR